MVYNYLIHVAFQSTLKAVNIQIQVVQVRLAIQSFHKLSH